LNTVPVGADVKPAGELCGGAIVTTSGIAGGTGDGTPAAV